MQDLMNSIAPVVAIAPVAAATDTVLKSGNISLLGYNSATFIIQTGDLTDADATFAVEIKEGDTTTQTAHVAVGDVDLIGTEADASFQFDDDTKCFKIGYSGGKDNVSIEITPTGNTANALIAVVCVLGHPHERPTANPPA